MLRASKRSSPSGLASSAEQRLERAGHMRARLPYPKRRVKARARGAGEGTSGWFAPPPMTASAHRTIHSGHVWTAPCGQALFGVATIAVGCSHVSGLLMQPLFTTAGPDVVREVGPDHFHGLDARDPKKVLPPRRSTDRHHAISTSATRDALRRVPLNYALQSCTPIAKPLIR